MAKAIPSVVTWQPWLVNHTLLRFCDDATLIPLNVSETPGVVAQLLSSLDLADHHAHLIHLSGDGGALPSDVPWSALPMGDLIVKLGSLDLCTIRAIHTHVGDRPDDPIVSPTQPWHEEDADPEFDHLQDANRAGFFHVAEHVCQDDDPRQVAKVLLLQQDGTSEWIQDANLDRLGSIPAFHHQGNTLHFFKVNTEACQRLLGVQVAMAIQGTYDPIHPNKWILLAGGQNLRRCKICLVPRTLTPRQCDELLEQQCHIAMRNLVACRGDEPLMLINGDVL